MLAQTKWISVEERLPETDHEHYLTTCREIALPENWTSITFWDGAKFRICEGYIVTDWQLLPEPAPPKKLGPFWVKEGYGFQKWAVVHKHNHIHAGMDESEARTLCDRLNKLWVQQGTTNEDYHDGTTDTSAMGSGATGSTACSRDRCADQ
jgi:hypothetical protein